jgi:hypothetical protein
LATSTEPPRRVPLPTPAVLVGAVYAVCVVGWLVIFTGDIVVSDKDPHRSEGPIESMVLIGTIGTAALVVGVGLAFWSTRTPERARVGTFVLTSLAVVTIVFFWSGAPGILGACAAWSAGLARGARPVSGAARVAGIVGAFVALLNVALAVGSVAFLPFD